MSYLLLQSGYVLYMAAAPELPVRPPSSDGREYLSWGYRSAPPKTGSLRCNVRCISMKTTSTFHLPGRGQTHIRIPGLNVSLRLAPDRTRWTVPFRSKIIPIGTNTTNDWTRWIGSEKGPWTSSASSRLCIGRSGLSLIEMEASPLVRSEQT